MSLWLGLAANNAIASTELFGDGAGPFMRIRLSGRAIGGERGLGGLIEVCSAMLQSFKMIVWVLKVAGAGLDVLSLGHAKALLGLKHAGQNCRCPLLQGGHKFAQVRRRSALEATQICIAGCTPRKRCASPLCRICARPIFIYRF